jgi:hypothetical protein
LFPLRGIYQHCHDRGNAIFDSALLDYNSYVEPNPYESPQHAEPPSNPSPRSRRPKSLWGYLIAVAVGAFLGGLLLTPLLADLDDAGGLEMLIGAFLGALIYGMLF